MIIAAERNRENRGPLVIENIDKIAIAVVMKILSVIDLNYKYNWLISNFDIDIAGDLGLDGIKKY